MFSYSSFSSDARLKAWLERYKRTQKPIVVNFRQTVTCLQSPDRATHLLHSYPAKLLMHIPFFFLSNSLLSKAGDTVLDPFCGSGTVLLEAQLSGRVGLGVDCNPLARLITRTKTTPLARRSLEKAMQLFAGTLPRQSSRCPPDVVNMSHWFYPHIIQQLLVILDVIDGVRSAPIRAFLRVCFSNCLRRVSLADPRLSVPVRLKPDQYPRAHLLYEKTQAHLRRLKRLNVLDVFRNVLAANCRRMESLAAVADGLPQAAMICSNARHLVPDQPADPSRVPEFGDGTVQLVVTSPPYPGAQKYIRASSLSLGWLGLCPSSDLRTYKQQTIGREEFKAASCSAPQRTGLSKANAAIKALWHVNPTRAAIASTYIVEMQESLHEIQRVLRPGGYLVLVCANNKLCGRPFMAKEYLRSAAQRAGLAPVLELVDTIRSRGLMTTRNHTAGVIRREWVLLFQKREGRRGLA